MLAVVVIVVVVVVCEFVSFSRRLSLLLLPDEAAASGNIGVIGGRQSLRLKWQRQRRRRRRQGKNWGQMVAFIWQRRDRAR